MSLNSTTNGHTNDNMGKSSMGSNSRATTNRSPSHSRRSNNSEAPNDHDEGNSMSRARMMNSLSRVTSIQSNPSAWYKLTICNPCRSECGYCHGDRAYVLTQDNPRKFAVGTLGAAGPQVEILAVKEEDIPISYRISSANASSIQIPSNNNKAGRSGQQQTVITKDTSSDAYCVHFSNISPEAYLKLINCGWRRSGKLLYMPKNWKSCCACYPIRLDTSPGVFKISKSQKKILKRFARCLATGRVSGTDDGNRNDNGKHAKSHIISKNGNGSNNPEKMDSIMESTTTKVSRSTQSKSSSSKTKRQRRQSNDGCSSSPSLDETIKIFAKELLMGASVNKDSNTSWNAPSSCTLVALLKEGTRARVDYTLSEARSEDVMKLREDDIFLDKLCSFHCTRAQVSRKRKPYSNSSTSPSTSVSSLNDDDISSSLTDTVIDITLSSKVCPALCGRSKGSIDKLKLGNDIIQSFRQDCCIAGYRWDSGMEGSSKGQMRERCSVSVKSLELHEKSSHINIHVVVIVQGYDFISGEIDTGSHKTSKSKVSTNEKLRSMIGNGEEKSRKVEIDIIAEFIRNSRCMGMDAVVGPMNARCNHQSLPHPPYRLTVKNVPSQISGCMPQVHRLYCKYQAAIHKDEDPFERPSSGGIRGPCCTRDKSKEMSEEEGMISDSDDHSTSTKSPEGNKRRKKITEADITQLYPEYDSFQQRKIFKK